MRTFLAPFCVMSMLVLAGCGTPLEQRLDAPAIRVVALAAAENKYALEVRVVNANAVPLVVNRSTHTVYFGDQRIGRVEDREPIGVPPLGAAPHTVALTGAAAAGARAWLAQHPGEVSVTIESTLEVAIGADNDTVNLTAAGRGVVKAL